MMDLSEIKKYRIVDDLLGRSQDIDLIDICNPTDAPSGYGDRGTEGRASMFWSRSASPWIAQRADAMVAAASCGQRLLMVAHVLPFVPEFAYAADSHPRWPVRQGAQAGHFKRVISRPDWSAEIGDAAKTGGPAIDLHIHDTHFIGLVCGVPGQVFAVGILENGVVTHLTTSYLYGPGGPAVTCSAERLAQKGRPFVHGFEDLPGTGDLDIRIGGDSHDDSHRRWPGRAAKLPGGSDPVAAFTVEIQTAVDAVVSGKEPDLLRGQLARDALVMCYKECESVRTGKAVSLSPGVGSQGSGGGA